MISEIGVSERRVRYFVLAIGTICVGLIVHFTGSFLPPAFRDVLGDALWAMMIVWWMGVAAPRLPLRTRALVSFAICVAVEFSQRYHTQSLDAFRRTVIGQLILGTGYDPRDLVSYAVGVVAAAALARVKVE